MLAIRSDSYDPKHPLPQEREEVRAHLFDDIPEKERVAYEENEKIWVIHKNPTNYIIAAPERSYLFWPIGVNGSIAMGFVHPVFLDHKKILQDSEASFFAQAWQQMLGRCKNREQGEKISNYFIDYIETDKSLEKAKELVDSGKAKELPEESGNLELYSDVYERPVGTHSVYLEPLDQTKRTISEGMDVKVLLNRYKTMYVWKSDKFELYCLKGTMPAGYLTDSYLLLAYSIDKEYTRVELRGLKNTAKVLKCFYVKLGGVIKCFYEEGTDTILVHNAYVLYACCGKNDMVQVHKISELITSAHVMQNGNICIGTINGHVYKVKESTSFIYVTANMLPVVHIASSGKKLVVQNIYEAILLDTPKLYKDLARNITTVRPVTCGILGTRILIVSKTGFIKLDWTNPDINPTIYKKPDGFRLEGKIPWYSGGVYLSRDGKEMTVLYSDGMVRYFRIK
jgi:hypothetical protein